MVKTVGILAFLAFIGAAAYSLVGMGETPSAMLTMAILPLWGVDVADCDNPLVECWTWSAVSGWGIPYTFALAYGWAIALACLIWRKWTTIDSSERQFSEAQALKRASVERQATNKEERRINNNE